MKAFLIPACVAVSAALAAELKDPTDVAREWRETVERAREPSVATLDLPREQAAPRRAEILPAASRSPLPTLPRSVLGPLYDAPSRPGPRRLPPEIPDRAIPWLYRGEEYRLVPLRGLPE